MQPDCSMQPDSHRTKHLKKLLRGCTEVFISRSMSCKLAAEAVLSSYKHEQSSRACVVCAALASPQGIAGHFHTAVSHACLLSPCILACVLSPDVRPPTLPMQPALECATNASVHADTQGRSANPF